MPLTSLGAAGRACLCHDGVESRVIVKRFQSRVSGKFSGQDEPVFDGMVQIGECFIRAFCWFFLLPVSRPLLRERPRWTSEALPQFDRRFDEPIHPRLRLQSVSRSA